MADISKIKLPNGTTYGIKDTTAREGSSVAASDLYKPATTFGTIAALGTSITNQSGVAILTLDTAAYNLINNQINNGKQVYLVASTTVSEPAVMRWRLGNSGDIFAGCNLFNVSAQIRALLPIKYSAQALATGYIGVYLHNATSALSGLSVQWQIFYA